MPHNDTTTAEIAERESTSCATTTSGILPVHVSLLDCNLRMCDTSHTRQVQFTTLASRMADLGAQPRVNSVVGT